MRSPGRWQYAWICLLLAMACGRPSPILAQQPVDSAAPQDEEERPLIRDSTVGYVDSAIPANVLRFRYDTAYKNLQPSRAEFFYANTGPGGHGLPLEEKSVDYQDISLYAEHLFTCRLSAFVELPVRFANFEVNENHSGIADMNLGFKFALIDTDETVLTSQFRLYVPTGNSREGLGTHHVSLEPALLLYQKLTDRMASESELRYWQSVGGTAHVAGAAFRYGTGVHYDLLRTCNFTVAPVVEVVGWTFVDGEDDATFALAVRDAVPNWNATGDTIVNAKLGVRVATNELGDFYAGYGRALTGEVLYRDILRFEFRLRY